MHNLTKLAIVAVIALGLAFWAGTSRQPVESVPANAALIPGLKDAVNSVATIKLSGAENRVIATLQRTDKGWTIAEKNGYAADVAKVREFLLKLADATLIEAKTSVVESYPKLGVEDLAGKDAKGALVEIDGLKTRVKIIIGNYNGQGGDGTFVRRVEEPQSWLAKGNITVDKVAANWLKKDLADLASNRIATIEIASGGKTLRVFKQEPTDPNYQVADVPKRRELASEFVANALGSVLSGLTFEDVMPADQAQAGDAKVFEASYFGFDGLDVNARAWERDGKDYATFKASLDETKAGQSIAREQARAKADYEAQKAAATVAATPKPADAATPAATPATPEAAPAIPEAPLAVSDAAKDREQKLAALRKEAADLNARFEGWAFVLPSYKFANINKSMDDMLKPVETAAKGAKPATPK